MQIESYRRRLEEYEQKLNRELYGYYSGFKDRLELTAVYSDYSDLFSVESIREVKSELENVRESFSSRRKSLQKIHEFLIDQHFDYRTASLNQEAERFAAQQTIPWEGKRLGLAQSLSLIKGERDAAKRRNLSERYAAALNNSEELMRNKISLLRATASALGFRNYIDARQYVTGVDYANLLNAVDESLGRLDDRYWESLRMSVDATLGIPLQEAGAWDVARWRMLNDPVQYFSDKNLLSVVQATMSEFGVQPEIPDAIAFDLEPRPQKRSRPFCIPIRVPHEIKVVMCPENGSGHYAALLHESGHAYSFAWTSSSLPVEHRIWGDRALSESYAFLFEHFLLDPEWLARMLSFEKSREFLRFQSLYRIFLIRRCAGRLRFALRLCQEESLDEISQIYSEIMKSYTGLLHRPETWLADFSDGFDSADYLRGWILECVLREHLFNRYGKAWNRNRAAAGFLKEIWETGQLYRADELAREIGIGKLEPQILADELSGGLQH
jgi:oligoendopeptidase F